MSLSNARRARPHGSKLASAAPPPDPDTAPALRFSGLTLWPRVAGPLRSFLRAETGGAVAMLGAAVAALVWANCPWPHSYESFWTTTLSVEIGHSGISHDLRWWVNEGLMTLYFLVVGLEARRELEVGQLRERGTVRIALLAAIGGMVAAVAIYLAFNAGGPGVAAGVSPCRPTRRFSSAYSRWRRQAELGFGFGCSRSRCSTTSSRWL